MKTHVTYIETADGYVPTRPAPLIIRTCSETAPYLWSVILIDHHGEEHVFADNCLRNGAETLAHTLATASIALTKPEIITVDLLMRILEANAAEKEREAKE